jgi:hypothetical protein
VIDCLREAGERMKDFLASLVFFKIYSYLRSPKMINKSRPRKGE